MAKTGWFNESHRHALASKGIETGRKVDAPMPLPNKILMVKDLPKNPKIDITNANFENEQMWGVLHTPQGDVRFEGYWEEGFFTIEKTSGAKISPEALSNLEEELSENYKNVYTDGTW